MADTKLGRDLPGEDPDTPLPVHPMTDFTGWGCDEEDIELGYCASNVAEPAGDLRVGEILGIEPKGFLYRGRFGIDR